ncbi:MAG: DUF937 domain-containing protein [Deltaproteobacteria bacterium]|nr:DUF937 domain-containing protein [Deltaproteobacteria bacterium]
MGLFDDVVSIVGKQLGGGGQNSLLAEAIAMINNPETGGLQGLVEKLQNGGLGEIVSSWIGTGENRPVSAGQIVDALGAEKIKELAVQAGIPEDQVSDGLAGLLPGIVDQLTPDGRVPQGNALSESIGALAAKFLKG